MTLELAKRTYDHFFKDKSRNTHLKSNTNLSYSENRDSTIIFEKQVSMK